MQKERLNTLLRSKTTQKRNGTTLKHMETEDFLFHETAMFIQMLKGHFELYMNEGFSILKMLLRDFIGSVLLISLVLYTPINLYFGIHKSVLINYLDYFLGAYFLVAILMGYVIHVRSVIISKKEFSVWKETAQGILTVSEFDTYFLNPLRYINKGIYIYFPLIILLYVCMSYLFFSQTIFIVN